MLAAQQTAWIPTSSTRKAGSPLTSTLLEPLMAGPIPGCGHPGQPCASESFLALSPNLPCPGIAPPFPARRSGALAGRVENGNRVLQAIVLGDVAFQDIDLALFVAWRWRSIVLCETVLLSGALEVGV
jgi:hypothetical protein